MSSNLVADFFRLLEQSDLKALEAMLHPRFLFRGKHYEPVAKSEWLEMIQAISKAFQDCKVVVRKCSLHQDMCMVTVQIQAKHVHPLLIHWPGFEQLEANGKQVLFQEQVLVKAHENRIIDLLLNNEKSLWQQWQEQALGVV